MLPATPYCSRAQFPQQCSCSRNFCGPRDKLLVAAAWPSCQATSYCASVYGRSERCLAKPVAICSDQSFSTASKATVAGPKRRSNKPYVRYSSRRWVPRGGWWSSCVTCHCVPWHGTDPVTNGMLVLQAQARPSGASSNEREAYLCSRALSSCTPPISSRPVAYVKAESTVSPTNQRVSIMPRSSVLLNRTNSTYVS